MSRIEKAREFRRAAVLSAQSASDEQALSMPSLYPEWAPNVAVGGEGQATIVRRGSNLYRVQQAHTTQVGWEPEINSTGLFVAINVSNSGTIEDPIPAAEGMEYVYGKYYLDPNGNIYLCERTGEAEGGTVVLQYLPSALVGHYFTEV